MRILVSGSHGMIASALLPRLNADGHELMSLVRQTPKAANEVEWNPSRGTIDGHALEGVDAVVHLAGESIAALRWTRAKKERIRDSRVKGTALLAHALATLKRRPRVMVCSSAVGYYGDRGSELLTESSSPGQGFLAEVVQNWEAGAEPARGAGIRVVSLRLGIVLSGKGGALKQMLLPFKLGLGGKLGNGRQYLSWIALDDAAAAFEFALRDDDLSGSVNAVAPETVTNADFTKALGRVLHRPTVVAMPAVALRALLGEIADEGLLASQRADSTKLMRAGFQFKLPTLEAALRQAVN